MKVQGLGAWGGSRSNVPSGGAGVGISGVATLTDGKRGIWLIQGFAMGERCPSRAQHG